MSDPNSPSKGNISDEDRAAIMAIDDREALEAYLTDKPKEWAHIIALQSALRIFPIICEPAEWTQKHPRLFDQLTLVSWRGLNISGVTLEYATPDMQNAAANAANAADAVANAAGAAANAAYAAANAANAADAVANAAANAAYAAANAAARAARAADAAVYVTGYAALWSILRAELVVLAQGDDLLQRPLWSDDGRDREQQNALSKLRALLDQNLENFRRDKKDTPWEVIADWYITLVQSDMRQTPWGPLGSDLDKKLALLDPKTFWLDDDWENRDLDAMMAQIGDMVGWPHYGRGGDKDEDDQRTKDEKIQTLIDQSSPEPFVNQNRMLDIRPNATFDQPTGSVSFIDLPKTQIAIIDTMLRDFPENVPEIVRASLETYREHLTENSTHPTPGILVAMFECLEGEIGVAMYAPPDVDISKEEASFWFGGGLRALFRHFVSNHEKLIEEYPRHIEREEHLKTISIDDDQARSPDFSANLKQMSESIEAQKNDPVMTEALAHFLNNLTEQIRNEQYKPPSNTDGQKQTNLKKRVLQLGGILGKIVNLGAALGNVITTNWGAVWDAIKSVFDYIIDMIL